MEYPETTVGGAVTDVTLTINHALQTSYVLLILEPDPAVTCKRMTVTSITKIQLMLSLSATVWAMEISLHGTHWMGVNAWCAGSENNLFHAELLDILYEGQFTLMLIKLWLLFELINPVL